METMQGYVSRVIFKNNENGYCVLAVTPNKGYRNQQTDTNQSQPGQDQDDLPIPPEESTVKFVGNIPGNSVREGDEYKFSGKWVTNPKFGKQFKFDDAEVVLPDSRAGVIAYFCSDHFYGIGPVAAGKIVDALGEDALEKLKNNPDAAFSVPGITGKQAKEIAAKMREHSTVGDLISLICGDGVSTNLAARIHARYGGEEALKLVKNNPYQLIQDLNGVGFKIADRIARITGVEPNSPFRVEAAIRHVLYEAQNEGHVALTAAEVNHTVLELLGPDCGVQPVDVGRIGASMVACEELYREKESNNLVYLVGMHRAEVSVAKKIRFLSEGGTGTGVQVNVDEADAAIEQDDLINIESMVDDVAAKSGIQYAPEQHQAIVTALTSNFSVITGGPGTGKSTITNAIVDIYQDLNPRDEIYLASPTGRAAKRLSEATGYEAKTIHRLLRYNPLLGGFTHNEYEPLPGPGLLIVDEFSMCDIELADSLFRAIPDDIKVVLVGDIDQLPSVGPGSVLRDVISSSVVPVTRLKYVYRQGKESTIAWLADKIRNGEKVNLERLTQKSIENGLNDFEFILAEDPSDAAVAIEKLVGELTEAGHDAMYFQVLTPLKSKGAAGADYLNKMIQRSINPPDEAKQELQYNATTYRLGDKIMVVKNNYHKGVFNGDLGIVVGLQRNKDGTGLYADIDGRPVWFGMDDMCEITLAYAYTIHKCVALDTLIETDHGLQRIGDAINGFVATIDGVKEYVRTPNQPEQQMLRIITEDGYQVTVTPDHGLDAWDGQQYRRFEAQELRVGNWLQIGLGVRLEPSEIPLLPEPTSGDIREQIFDVPRLLTTSAAEFIGLIVADGTVFHGGFRLAKRHKEVVDRFCYLCNVLFGVEPKRWTRGNAHFGEVSSTFLSRWIIGIGGMSPNQKAVPNCILAGHSEHHKAFLRGLFEDAAVNLRTSNSDFVDHIDFCTCKESLAADVQVMLARLGIVANHVRNVGPYNHSKLYIYGKYAQIFGKTIGFISHEKQKRIALQAGCQKLFTIPVTRNEAEEIYQLNDSVFTYSDLGNARTRGHISRHKFNVLINVPEWLKERALNHHTRIASIEKIIAKSTCLNVPDGHRFLQNAISGWNSQGGEFPLAIVVCLRSHYIMLQRNLIYTAITRAKQKLIVVGQQSAWDVAIKNNKIIKRNSLLAERLKGVV